MSLVNSGEVTIELRLLAAGKKLICMSYDDRAKYLETRKSRFNLIAYYCLVCETIVYTKPEDYDNPGIPVTEEDIVEMDEVFGWIDLIPKNRPMLRRLVAARCLIDAHGEHVFSWKFLLDYFKPSLEMLIRKYREGIAVIEAELSKRDSPSENHYKIFNYTTNVTTNVTTGSRNICIGYNACSDLLPDDTEVTIIGPSADNSPKIAKTEDIVEGDVLSKKKRWTPFLKNLWNFTWW